MSQQVELELAFDITAINTGETFHFEVKGNGEHGIEWETPMMKAGPLLKPTPAKGAFREVSKCYFVFRMRGEETKDCMQDHASQSERLMKQFAKFRRVITENKYVYTIKGGEIQTDVPFVCADWHSRITLDEWGVYADIEMYFRVAGADRVAHSLKRAHV